MKKLILSTIMISLPFASNAQTELEPPVEKQSGKAAIGAAVGGTATVVIGCLVIRKCRVLAQNLGEFTVGKAFKNSDEITEEIGKRPRRAFFVRRLVRNLDSETQADALISGFEIIVKDNPNILATQYQSTSSLLLENIARHRLLRDATAKMIIDQPQLAKQFAGEGSVPFSFSQLEIFLSLAENHNHSVFAKSYLDSASEKIIYIKNKYRGKTIPDDVNQRLKFLVKEYESLKTKIADMDIDLNKSQVGNRTQKAVNETATDDNLVEFAITEIIGSSIDEVAEQTARNADNIDIPDTPTFPELLNTDGFFNDVVEFFEDIGDIF